MEEVLVSNELAVLARELGFPQRNGKGYDRGKFTTISITMGSFSDHGDRYATAPTLSLLQKYVRETCKTHVSVVSDKSLKWNFWIYYLDPYGCTFADDEIDHDTYEEALEAGLKIAIEAHIKEVVKFKDN